MSELLLCRQGIASMPFYIENSAVNVYSLEELSYYILHNLYLIDQEIISEELCSWIEKELHEEELAGKLREIRTMRGTVYHFVMTLLIETGYCSREELEEADRILKELADKSRAQCRKIRADRYLKNRKYAKCIVEYTGLLEEDISEETEELCGNVWNNLGCAYAGLFLFEEAEDCFRKAYEKNKNQVSLDMISICVKMRSEDEYVMEEYESPEFTEKIAKIQSIRESNPKEYMDMVTNTVNEWKEEYRSYCRI